MPGAAEQCTVTTTGAKENEALPRNAVNLIYRAMSFAALREGAALPPVELLVHNEIPLASGLGSSAAAIVAGIKLGGLITGKQISDQTIQNYATEFEGHPDNVAASLYGGFVASCCLQRRQRSSQQNSHGLLRFALSSCRRTRNCRHTSRAPRCREPSAARTPYTTCKEPLSLPPHSRSNVTTCFGKRCTTACTSRNENHSCPVSQKR